tara:strand:+ start:3110 stop:3421 length:312 start_codon:yes stop_codon:yes gene_type:complete
MSIKHLTFDDSATIAFGSITGTYANLLALSDDSDVIFVFNTCDTAIYLSIPSGYAASKNIRFPAKTSIAIDCRGNSKRLAKGTIQVKYDTAPTLGEVTITACR